MLQDHILVLMVLYMSTMESKDLSPKVIRKYRKKCIPYTEGKGKLLPKWLKAPDIDKDWLWKKKYDSLDEDLMTKLYPFKSDTSVELKFRILLVQRLSCFLAGYDSSYEYVQAIEEWIRQILVSNDAERLRNSLGVKIEF